MVPYFDQLNKLNYGEKEGNPGEEFQSFLLDFPLNEH